MRIIEPNSKEYNSTVERIKLLERLLPRKTSNCTKSYRISGIFMKKETEPLGIGTIHSELEKLCNPCITGKIHDNSGFEICPSIHAEQNAMIDALKTGKNLSGGMLYHMKIKNGEWQTTEGPGCIVCGLMGANLGLNLALYLKEGFAVYSPEEQLEITVRNKLQKYNEKNPNAKIDFDF